MCKYSGFKIVVINIGSIQRKLLSHLWLETEQKQQQQDAEILDVLTWGRFDFLLLQGTNNLEGAKFSFIV